VFSADLSTRSYDGRSVVTWRGEPDLVDAAAVAAALTADVSVCVTVEEAAGEAEHLREWAPDVAV